MTHLSERRPTFIGIGAQKSATTWCAEMLRLHPEVDFAQPKELDYFQDNFDRGPKWYMEHFSDPTLPVRGEISPLYMDHPEVAGRIADAYPEVTLLVVLRNPYARALSNLQHDIRGTDGQVSSTGAEQARLIARQNDKYVRRSCYAEALHPYYCRFSPAQIALLFYDDFIRDKPSFLQALYRSVGAQADFVPPDFDRAINKTVDYRMPSLFRTLRKVSRTAKSWGPTQRGMQWVYRRTRLRELVLSRLRTNRSGTQWEFADVFDPQAVERIAHDVERLQTELGIAVPESWRDPCQAKTLSQN